MKRGDVYWAEQTGRRPVIVLSHDGFNQNPKWKSIIVVPITSSALQAKRGPTVVALPAVAGLSKLSVAICHQVTTLDRAKLTKKIGALPFEILIAVEEGLRAALDLD
jgi:mRNA-degrading endonuclease toxin of MazEF toxin-antitoxin module